MNKKEVFRELERRIPKEKLAKAEEEANSYITKLQSEVDFKLSLSLKKFIEARR